MLVCRHRVGTVEIVLLLVVLRMEQSYFPLSEQQVLQLLLQGVESPQPVYISSRQLLMDELVPHNQAGSIHFHLWVYWPSQHLLLLLLLGTKIVVHTHHFLQD